MMSRRENILRSVRFEQPERIPMQFCINSACYHHYPRSVLDELRESHPYLFPDFRRSSAPPTARTPPTQSSRVDAWGVTMASPEEGIAAVAVRHPLADWDALECYAPPLLPELSEEEKKRPNLAAENMQKAIAADTLVYGGLQHGHTFLRLCDLRGYEALICDMADDEPRLWRLIEMVEAHNMATVRCSLRRGAEWMGYPEDLGMQGGRCFRRSTCGGTSSQVTSGSCNRRAMQGVSSICIRTATHATWWTTWWIAEYRL